MAKLFGEYLVETGLISKDDLLAALIEQIRNLPTFAEVIFDKNLLGCEEFLDALKIQSSSGSELSAVLEQMDVSISELQQEYEAAVAAARVPLGKILVKRGIIDFNRLIHALDDFVYESGAEKPKPKSEVEIQEPLNKIEPNLVSQFMGAFSEAALSIIGNLPKNAENEESAKEHLHAIVAASRFVGASLTEKLSEAMLRAVTKKLYVSNHEAFETGVLSLQGIQTSLRENCSEANFWESNDNQKLFLQVTQAFSE